MSESNSRITVCIRLGTSVRFTIPKADSGDILTSNSTILQVKTLISKEDACDKCSVARQRLIYKGRIMSDDARTLNDYGLSGDNQTIHLVKGADRSSPNNPASGAASTNTSTNSTNSANNNASNSFGFGGANNNSSNPFTAMQQMMQNSGGNGAFPSMNEMHQQMMQNPEMLQNMMQSPIMQNLMSNPDMIRMMMESNPEMRRVMDSNPQVRAIFDDPELMRRSMEMMRDPSAMQNMMRNQELAMSQIENLPGGFNALRRMYEDVQEPMMDAMSSGGLSGAANSSNSNSSSTNTSSSSNNDGARGAAIPNPWGASASSSSSTSSNSNNSPETGTPAPFSLPNLFAGANNSNSTNPWANNSTGQNDGASPLGMGMPGMPNPNMNMEQIIQMLENPMMNNMMQQMMSDPQMLQQMMDSNPMMQQLRQTNPAAAAMMSNPETLRQMMNPENMRAMLQAQQAFQSLGQNMPGGFPMMPPTWGSMGSSNNNSNNSSSTDDSGLDFSRLLNQFQSASVSSPSPAPPTSTLPPEQRYASQLSTLSDMGFTDSEANIRALTECNGNLNRAIEKLVSGS